MAARSPPAGRRGWLREGAAVAGSVAAGASLPLAFAPFSLWWWAPIPVAVFFVATRGAGWRRGAARAAGFAGGFFAAGISWIVESFQYNDVPYPLAVLATGALVAGLAIYVGGLGAALGRLWPRRGGGVLSWLGLASLWTLFEWGRGTLFTGFPWLVLGASQIDGPLAGWLPVLGMYGTSVLVALIAAGLSGWLAEPGRGSALRVAIVTGVLVAPSGWLAPRVWTQPGSESLAVALVQGNVPQDEKWAPERREPILQRYLALSRRHWDADLVVWPETAVPGLLRPMRPFLRAVEREADAAGAEVLVGIPAREPDTGRGVNAVVKLGGPDAGALYVKRRLVPFGEYVPWAPLLDPVLAGLGVRLASFASGPADQRLLTAAGHPLGVSICYEIAFAAEIRRALPEARLLVNVSNDAWFGDTLGPHQHLQLARVRAREAGRWLVRATNTGISAIVDPRGAVRARMPQFEAATLAGEVLPYRGLSPYHRVGDGPIVAGIVVLALLGWRRRSG